MRSFQEAAYHLNLLPPLDVKRCRDCGFIFLCPRPDALEREALFTDEVPHLLLPYSKAGANYGAVTEGRLELFRKRVDHLVSLAQRKDATLSLLDIGASSGYMVQAAIEAGLNARGVEPGIAGVTVARQRGIELEKGTAEQLPYDNNSFDIAHSHHVFEHVADPLQSAREVYRVLKPGGVFLVEVPNQFDNIRFWRDMLLSRVRQRKRDIRSVHHLSFFSRRSLKRLFNTAGFKEVRIVSRYAVKPKGTSALAGWLTMAIGTMFLGGERIIATGKKIV